MGTALVYRISKGKLERRITDGSCRQSRIDLEPLFTYSILLSISNSELLNPPRSVGVGVRMGKDIPRR